MKFTPEHIIETLDSFDVKIHPKRYKNIYQYGSRVYGCNDSDSDYDIVVVAAYPKAQDIICRYGDDDTEYNIHIYSPDRFKDDLEKHKMLNLECAFLPEEFVIMQNDPISFVLKKKKMAKTLLNASHNSWFKAKMRLRDMDVRRGLKSLYHSLRILMFADQIMDADRIFDYSESNYLWEEIDGCDEVKWDYFKEKYLPFKQLLEQQILEKSDGD
jgi:predicted nucleotidyltransferase